MKSFLRSILWVFPGLLATFSGCTLSPSVGSDLARQDSGVPFDGRTTPPTPSALAVDAARSAAIPDNDSSFPDAATPRASVSNVNTDGGAPPSTFESGAPAPVDDRDSAVSLGDSTSDAGDSAATEEVGDVGAGDTGPADAGVVSGCTSPPRYLLSPGRVLLLEGHADIFTFELDCASSEPRLVLSTSYNGQVGGDLVEHVAFGEAVLVAGAGTKLAVPELQVPNKEEFAANAGDEVWMFRESATESYGIPWPGAQSYHVPRGELAGEVVYLSLVDSEVPEGGRAQLFLSPQDPYSPFTFLLDTERSIGPWPVPSETHVHMNWLFTKPGIYRLTFQATGTLNDGTPLVSPEQVLTIFVGELSELPQSEPAMVVAEREYLEDGEVLRLTPVTFGAVAGHTVRWSEQCAELLGEEWSLSGWSVFAASDSIDLVPGANPYATISCEYRAELVNTDDAVVAVSQSVPL
jgi:surface-anchored protein